VVQGEGPDFNPQNWKKKKKTKDCACTSVPPKWGHRCFFLW
jgi:hypothetical protein